ncbi:hypothetical protein L596_020280 [Steinernema carpocapsae]|uniref:MADF domain-containing protein n=1 Tax=Steinernema carpocapsae TaxID=34508 RepID=A0A4U5MT60_STECR|nr:hypothetical protein L596_020280 [Steinernema carpocapsae]
MVDQNLIFRVVQRKKREKLFSLEWVPNQRHSTNFAHMTQILVILRAFDEFPITPSPNAPRNTSARRRNQRLSGFNEYSKNTDPAVASISPQSVHFVRRTTINLKATLVFFFFSLATMGRECLIDMNGKEAVDELVALIEGFPLLYHVGKKMEFQRLKGPAKESWNQLMTQMTIKFLEIREDLVWKAWKTIRNEYFRERCPQKWRGRLPFLGEQEHPNRRNDDANVDDKTLKSQKGKKDQERSRALEDGNKAQENVEAAGTSESCPMGANLASPSIKTFSTSSQSVAKKPRAMSVKDGRVLQAIRDSQNKASPQDGQACTQPLQEPSCEPFEPAHKKHQNSAAVEDPFVIKIEEPELEDAEMMAVSLPELEEQVYAIGCPISGTPPQTAHFSLQTANVSFSESAQPVLKKPKKSALADQPVKIKIKDSEPEDVEILWASPQYASAEPVAKKPQNFTTLEKPIMIKIEDSELENKEIHVLTPPPTPVNIPQQEIENEEGGPEEGFKMLLRETWNRMCRTNDSRIGICQLKKTVMEEVEKTFREHESEETEGEAM